MKIRGLLALVALYCYCCCCCLEVCTAEPAYQSSGWRPQGQSLNPCYLPPVKMRTTKQHRESTSTPRSREQMTPRNVNLNDDNDDNSNGVNESTSEESNNEQSPALAVANSFAFNRPIYVYNAYPYRFPSAYLLRG